LMRFAGVAVAVDAALALTVAAIFTRHGIAVEWSGLAPRLVLDALLLGGWMVQRWLPDPRNEGRIADLFIMLMLTGSLVAIVLPAQYAALILGSPFADSWLAAADRALGVHVPSIARWTGQHPWLLSYLSFCYQSLPLQLTATPIVLVLLHKRTDRALEFVFNFHVCLLITLAGMALFPARGVFTHYGFQPLFNFDGVVRHIAGYRDGGLALVRFDQLEGLISFPSFHAATAFMVTWAFRDRVRWMIPVAALNAGLVLATVLSGAHYMVDIFATVAVFALSVAAWRLWVSGAVAPAYCEPTPFSRVVTMSPSDDST
jgi:hypothetical protein